MNRRIFVAVVLGLGAWLLACGGSRAGTGARWEFLGERVVRGQVDTDIIEVGRVEGRFRQIRFDVKGSALEMFDVVVTFGDGEKFSPETRFVFRRGEWSRIIDLPGAERIIRSVKFSYGNLPGGGRARLKLYAR